jgi:hypothetical protein
VEEITGLLSPVPSAKPPTTLLTLGVDDKTQAKIQAGEFIKFSALLSAQTYTDADQYRSVEKDGQLIFVKNARKNGIRSLTK